MTHDRSIAALFVDDSALGAVFAALESSGFPLATLWIAARSERAVARCRREHPDVAFLSSALHADGMLAGLARAAGFAPDAESGAFESELLRLGVDEERTEYFSTELVDPKVLVGFDASFESERVLRILVDAGADLGLVNGAGLVATIPLRKETLEVRKVVVLDAEVIVRTEVVSETKRIDVVLERVEYVIEHRDLLAPGQPVTFTRIPLRHEEAVFDKRVVIVAEVTVRTDQHVDASVVTEELQHEILRIDDPSGVVRSVTPPNSTPFLS